MRVDDPVSTCLIADLDSVRQADPVIRGADGRPRVVEALRLGRLLCDQIALPSNQILDGYIALTLGPRGISRLCGSEDETPLVALVETGSLATDIVALLRRLGTFHWSTLDALNLGGGSLQDLSLELPDDVTAPDAIRRLRQVAEQRGGDAHEAAEWLATGWLPWLEVEEARLLGSRPWERFTEIVIDPPSTWGLEDTVIDRWRDTPRRSVVFADIDDFDVPASRKQEIRDWWNDRYLQAIADANDMFWLRVTDEEGDAPTRRSDGSDRELRLTGDARQEIRRMPSTVFGWVVYKCALVQRAWEKQPDSRALRRVAHQVNRASRPEDPFVEQRSMWVRVTLTCVVAIAAVLLEATASGLAHGIGLTLIVVVLGGMAAVPYGELFERWQNRKTEMAAIVRKTG